MTLPDRYLDLFDRNPIAHVASTRPDGWPHVTPVWIDYDGEHLVIAGRRNKQRHVNVREDPRVAVSVMDPDHPYDALLVEGVVNELAPDGALAFLDEKAQDHLGLEEHPIRDDDRLLMKITIENVIDAGANFET